MGDYSLPTERIAEVKTPTIVLDGGASFPFIRETAVEVAKLLPSAQHRTLEGQQHNDDPSVLAPAMVAFCKG